MTMLKKVHEKVHVLKIKKSYSDPKIYSGKNYDLSKSWYVYYSFRNPSTGKLERQPNIKEGVNYFKTKKERLAVLKEIQKYLLELLQDGANPYEVVEHVEISSAVTALDYALSIKKNEVGERTYKDYEGHINLFKEWLSAKYPPIDIKEVDKKIINLFLNSIASKSSNRSRNNYRGSLSAVFSVLVEYDYIEKNFILEIKNLETKSKRDPTYSDEEVKTITEHLKANDPVLLMYVYFVSYLFWRPKENCRLQVKDVNLEQKLISVTTKTKASKTKLIPDIIYDDLAEYIKNANPEDLLFTPNGAGKWERDLDGRRSYFTLKFNRIKKILGIEGTIYSFRHSFITKVYKALIKDHTKGKSLEILASITGHTSKAMLDYIHYVDASLPDEYSKYLK